MTALARARLRSFTIHAVLFLVLGFWMIPQIYMLSIGLRTPAQAFDPALFTLPITFGNFVTVIGDNPLGQIFVNSLIVTIATVAIVVAVSSLFAFACAVLRLKGSMVLYSTLLTTLMVPLASLVLPLRSFFKTFGWVNTYWGLIFPYAALGVPFGMVDSESLHGGLCRANCSTQRRSTAAMRGRSTGMSPCRWCGRRWCSLPSGSLS